MVKRSEITNCRDNVHIINTNSAHYQNHGRININMFSQHSGPQQGKRHNAISETSVKGKNCH